MTTDLRSFLLGMEGNFLGLCALELQVHMQVTMDTLIKGVGLTWFPRQVV